MATTTKTWLLNWIRVASNFIGLFFKCCNTFWELKSEGLYRSSGKGKENCLAFTSFTKREIRHFHFVVVQLRQRNVEKSVINVQTCCFETYCFFAFLVAVAVVKTQVSYSPSLRAVKWKYWAYAGSWDGLALPVLTGVFLWYRLAILQSSDLQVLTQTAPKLAN